MNYQEAKSFFAGDIKEDKQTLQTYAKDASLFEVCPKAVFVPKDSNDIVQLVKWVGQKKKDHPELSITARSAGTCMSGGPLNESIILDLTTHLNQIGQIDQQNQSISSEPGVYYRDFEKKTLEFDLLLPSYTASKSICAIGGMVGNNSGGEKTLKYGKTEDYILSQKMVFADGVERLIEPLSKQQLEEKKQQTDFEGQVYRKIWQLITDNQEVIKAAKPAVSKNSAGYYIWNVYDEEREIFDLNKLIVGSQGTLGITTEVKFQLIKQPKNSRLMAVFVNDFSVLGDLVKEVLQFQPDSLETYDDQTMKLAVKFFPDFFRSLGFWPALKLGWQFLPELKMLLTGGMPKLVLLVEFSGSEQEVEDKMIDLEKNIKARGLQKHIATSSAESEKYWTIRRESFTLLRKHSKGKRTAPFIDDIIVRPEFLPEFLPKLEKILSAYPQLRHTIAGHAGDGNFHIIPLIDQDDKDFSKIVLEVSDQVYDLVLQYKGSITAEHNDGIIRTPYLQQMYGKQITDIFAEIKNIFDPDNIFNPGKKVGLDKNYLQAHLNLHTDRSNCN